MVADSILAISTIFEAGYVMNSCGRSFNTAASMMPNQNNELCGFFTYVIQAFQINDDDKLISFRGF